MKNKLLIIPLITMLSGCALFCTKDDIYTEPITVTKEVLIPVADLPKAPETSTQFDVNDLPYKQLKESDRGNYPKIFKSLYSSLKILEAEIKIKTDFIKAYNEAVERVNNKNSKKENLNKSSN